MGPIREDPTAMAVEVRHHDLDGVIGNGFRAVPGMAFQRPAHAGTFLRTEPHDTVAVDIKLHLVHIADAKRGGLIVDAVIGAVFQLDGVRTGSQGRAGKQAQDAHQSQKHGHDSNLQRMRLFLHVVSFPRKRKTEGTRHSSRNKQAVGR